MDMDNMAMDWRIVQVSESSRVVSVSQTYCPLDSGYYYSSPGP